MNIRLLSVLLVLGSSAVTFANGFRCDNATQKGRPQWSVQVYNNEENKPTTYVLATAKQTEKLRTIARVTDERRIVLGGEGQNGTTYSIILDKDEQKKLVELGDQRLTKLDEVERVQLWVNWDSGDTDVEEGDEIAGRLSLKNEDGESLGATYRPTVKCSYTKRNR